MKSNNNKKKITWNPHRIKIGKLILSSHHSVAIVWWKKKASARTIWGRVFVCWRFSLKISSLTFRNLCTVGPLITLKLYARLSLPLTAKGRTKRNRSTRYILLCNNFLGNGTEQESTTEGGCKGQSRPETGSHPLVDMEIWLLFVKCAVSTVPIKFHCFFKMLAVIVFIQREREKKGLNEFNGSIKF